MKSNQIIWIDWFLYKTIVSIDYYQNSTKILWFLPMFLKWFNYKKNFWKGWNWKTDWVERLTYHAKIRFDGVLSLNMVSLYRFTFLCWERILHIKQKFLMKSKLSRYVCNMKFFHKIGQLIITEIEKTMNFCVILDISN